MVVEICLIQQHHIKIIQFLSVLNVLYLLDFYTVFTNSVLGVFVKFSSTPGKNLSQKYGKVAQYVLYTEWMARFTLILGLCYLRRYGNVQKTCFKTIIILQFCLVSILVQILNTIQSKTGISLIIYRFLQYTELHLPFSI